MTNPGIRYPRAILAALVSLTALSSAARAAPPADFDAVTERVREILRDDGASSTWGADPPAEEIAARGEPFAATVLSGAGHALLAFDSEGRPLGSHLSLLHVRVEGSVAWANECELRLGKADDRSCPPEPMAVVDCAAWSVPVGTVRDATLAARAALFVRVYEKKFISGPREEIEHDGPISGVSGSLGRMSTADFVSVANVMESAEHPTRVAEEWAGYASSNSAGQYARAVAAARILREAFQRPNDAPMSAPPPAVHAEFSRLFAKLPLDSDSWWWVRERMVLMAASLGLPADLARLEKLAKGSDKTRAYALEALARRTGRDPRCDGGRRVTDAVAAAAWERAQ